MAKTMAQDPKSKTKLNNIPELMLKGFKSYTSLEDKISQLVEVIQNKRIDVMDHKEVSKYPFISAYVQKKSQNLEKELVISTRKPGETVHNE
jgi:hypothetical protein